MFVVLPLTYLPNLLPNLQPSRVLRPPSSSSRSACFSQYYFKHVAAVKLLLLSVPPPPHVIKIEFGRALNLFFRGHLGTACSYGLIRGVSSGRDGLFSQVVTTLFRMTCLLTSQVLSAQVKDLALPDVLQVFGQKSQHTFNCLDCRKVV